MNNIREAFKKGNAFIPFITCGDPDLETTERIVRAAVENGADMIELGIPFSDPTAEGPIIQEANIRALAGGITTDMIFEFVRELRKAIKIPFIFMTYANVVFSYGADQFIATCKEVGVDGIILPDLPFEEKKEFQPLCKQYGVALISQIAPTSNKRVAMIAKEAEGFLYIASGADVTGVGSEMTENLSSMVKVVRENTDIPCAIGFDNITSEQIEKMSGFADGVIANTGVIKIMEEYGRCAGDAVGRYVKHMKCGLRQVK